MSLKVRAHFDGRGFIPDEPVDMPTDAAVELTIDPATAPGHQEPARAPRPEPTDTPAPDCSADTFADWVESRPPLTGWDSPGDGAAQLDHYIYGTAKRERP